jgi:hypothetical protein
VTPAAKDDLEAHMAGFSSVEEWREKHRMEVEDVDSEYDEP